MIFFFFSLTTEDDDAENGIGSGTGIGEDEDENTGWVDWVDVKSAGTKFIVFSDGLFGNFWDTGGAG